MLEQNKVTFTVVKQTSEASSFTFSTPSPSREEQKRLKFNSIKEMEQHVDENIPADYFIKINGDPEELMLQLNKTRLKRL